MDLPDTNRAAIASRNCEIAHAIELTFVDQTPDRPDGHHQGLARRRNGVGERCRVMRTCRADRSAPIRQRRARFAGQLASGLEKLATSLTRSAWRLAPVLP